MPDVEPERRVRRHGPAPRVVRGGARPAEEVEACVVRLHVVALQQVHVVRGGADRLALAGRAVVGGEHDDGA